MGWDQHRGCAKVAPNARSEHRSCSSKCNEPQLPRIDPIVKRYFAGRFNHVRGGEIEDPESCFLYRHPEALCEPLDGRPCQPRIERYVGALNQFRAQHTQDDQGVRDGRLRAPAAITCRTGNCPRSMGPYPKSTKMVDPGDRSTTGTDAVNVDRWKRDEQVVLYFELGRDSRLAVYHDGRM